jgi:hypothetical protein
MNSSILTLEELADYLKLSPEVILKQTNQGRLPRRKIEDTWRFLKDAIDGDRSEFCVSGLESKR